MGAHWGKHGARGGGNSLAATPIAVVPTTTMATAAEPLPSVGAISTAMLRRSSSLRRYRAAPPHGGIMKRTNAPPRRPVRPFWWQSLCASRRRRQRVSQRVVFRNTIVVTEFARLLDGGGTIPGDGTNVTLGLGRPLRSTFAPLGVQPFRKRPIEESAWVPNRERVRLLRKSMGDARYFGAWAKRRWEVARIRRSRHESTCDPKDRILMPSSLREAQERAFDLQVSIATTVMAPSPLKPPPSVWPKSDKPTALKRKLRNSAVPPKTQSPKKAHLIGRMPTPLRRTVHFAGTGFGAGTKCHLCMRDIAEGEPDQRCMCLAKLPLTMMPA